MRSSKSLGLFDPARLSHRAGSAWKACAAVLGFLAASAVPGMAGAQDNPLPPAGATTDPPRATDLPPTAPGALPPSPATSGPYPSLPPVPPGERSSLDAPPPPPPPPFHDRPRRPTFGGFGYGAIGPFFGDLSTLDTALQSPEAFGASYGIGRSAMTIGGGGGAVLFGHLWVGGKGFGLLTAPFNSARGEATLTGGGGGFELGYVLARSRMLVIPYFGFGGFSYNLNIKNESARTMNIQQSMLVAPGESRTFKAGFATAELGLRLQRLLFSGDGGLMGGVEAGVLRSLTAAPWRWERYEFVQHKGAVIDGVYVRITVGGGGFLCR
jgi:hypothetical protein